MIRYAMLLSLLVSAPVATALGCEGKQILFEDQFNDDSGGWATMPGIRVENSSFIFRIPAPASTAMMSAAVRTLNVTFSFKDADICAEAVWPHDDVSHTSVALMFLAQDYGNFFLLPIRGDGTAAILRQQNGKWMTVSDYAPFRAVKTSSGATNVLRAKVKGNLVSLFVNNEKLRDIRVQALQQDWQVGLWAENGDNEKEAEVQFKHVKVTDAP